MNDSLSLVRWPLIAAILTPHAVPDTLETNNHWTTSCQPLSLHGLGQGSGIRTGQGTQYCTVVAGSSERTLAALYEVPSLQSSLEALRFNTSHLTHCHVSRGATSDRKADTCSDGHPQHVRLTRTLPACLPCGTSGPTHSHVSLCALHLDPCVRHML